MGAKLKLSMQIKAFFRLVVFLTLPILFYAVLIAQNPKPADAATCNFWINQHVYPANATSPPLEFWMTIHTPGNNYNFRITDPTGHSDIGILDSSNSYYEKIPLSDLQFGGFDLNADTLTITVKDQDGTTCGNDISYTVIFGDGSPGNKPNIPLGCTVQTPQDTPGGKFGVTLHGSALDDKNASYAVDINPGYYHIGSVSYISFPWDFWLSDFNLPQSIAPGTYTVVVETSPPVTCTPDLQVSLTLAKCDASSPGLKAGDDFAVIGQQFPVGDYPVELVNVNGTPDYKNIATFRVVELDPAIHYTQGGAMVTIPKDALVGTYAVNITDLPGSPSQVQCTNSLSIGVAAGGGAGKNPCNGGICQTALGTIPINLGDFASTLLKIALGISGGIVLILMVIGSIRVMTSSGDPQKMAGGRDMIVAAIAGALFIAFSVMIMQFIGIAIVPIPGLGYFTG